MPQFVESYLVPDETTSESWVDAVLAEIKGRRPGSPASLIRVGSPVS